MSVSAMKTVRRIFVCAFSMILVLLIGVIFAGALMNKLLSPSFLTQVRAVDNFTFEREGESGAVELPHSFTGLEGREAVTLCAQVIANSRESLLVKTVYAPLSVYMDDVLLFACGQDGDYPDFLLDPPTMIAMIPLPESREAKLLRLEFLSPSQRDTLTVPAVYVGEEAALFLRLARQNVFLLALSVSFIFLGIVALLTWLILLRGLPAAASFLWLGLFSAASGMWGLGECNLTALLLPYPSLLYAMAFIGLFFLTIPILRFGILVLNPKNKWPLYIMLTVNCACFFAALLLQFCKIADFSRTMYAFHVIEPALLSAFALYAAWEYFRHRNEAAAQFMPPIFTVALSAVLELLNYQFRFTDVLSSFFQCGMLIFLIQMLRIGARFVSGTIKDLQDKKRLELEMSFLGRQMDMQREQYTAIAQNAAFVKAQHHDLRHQLAVIRRFNDVGDARGLEAYLNELAANLPVGDRSLCENFAVNAVALNYLALAEAAGISAELRINLPAGVGRVQDADLCIVIGNLLENAIEACGRMMSGERFITLHTRMRYDVLTITMDNSFDGTWEERGGVIYSRKRDGEGIGLSSMQAVARKYGGKAKFEANGNVWLSSVYLKTS